MENKEPIIVDETNHSEDSDYKVLLQNLELDETDEKAKEIKQIMENYEPLSNAINSIPFNKKDELIKYVEVSRIEFINTKYVDERKSISTTLKCAAVFEANTIGNKKVYAEYKVITSSNKKLGTFKKVLCNMFGLKDTSCNEVVFKVPFPSSKLNSILCEINKMAKNISFDKDAMSKYMIKTLRDNDVINTLKNTLNPTKLTEKDPSMLPYQLNNSISTEKTDNI